MSEPETRGQSVNNAFYYGAGIAVATWNYKPFVTALAIGFLCAVAMYVFGRLGAASDRFLNERLHKATP